MEQTLSGHDFVVANVAFSPDGATLASSSFDETIKVWNWQQSTERCTLRGHSGFVYGLGFDAQGAVLASGGYDGLVKTWPLNDKKTGCSAS